MGLESPEFYVGKAKNVERWLAKGRDLRGMTFYGEGVRELENVLEYYKVAHDMSYFIKQMEFHEDIDRSVMPYAAKDGILNLAKCREVIEARACNLYEELFGHDSLTREKVDEILERPEDVFIGVITEGLDYLDDVDGGGIGDDTERDDDFNGFSDIDKPNDPNLGGGN